LVSLPLPVQIAVNAAVRLTDLVARDDRQRWRLLSSRAIAD
jgi:hypothetical protein